MNYVHKSKNRIKSSFCISLLIREAHLGRAIAMEKTLFNRLVKQEKQLIAKSGNLDALGELIDDEFMEVGSLNGFIDKQEVLGWLASPETSNRVSLQFKAKQLSN